MIESSKCRHRARCNRESKAQVSLVAGAKPTHVWSTCFPATKRHSYSSVPPNIFANIIWIHYIPTVVVCGYATHAKFYAMCFFIMSGGGPTVRRSNSSSFRNSPTYILSDQLQNTQLKQVLHPKISTVELSTHCCNYPHTISIPVNLKCLRCVL